MPARRISPPPPRARLALAALIGAAAAGLALSPARADAQFGRGRGGGRGEERSDSGAARPARDPSTINTVDVILEKRGALGLNDDQAARVGAIKRERDAAAAELQSRADALKPPSDPNAWTAMSDSERVAMRGRLRERAAALRALRDAEAKAQADALAVLTPEQQARVGKLEDDERKAAAAVARFGGAARNGGSFGGRPPR